MMMAGQCTPHFLFFSPEKKRKRAVHGPKEKKTWGENLPMRANFAQSTGAGLNRCQCELPVFCRLRLTPFRPEPLCRSCNCPRGCFVSLTQSPQRLFPRFAHGPPRSGGSAPPVNKLSFQHGAARREAREEKNVPASTHQISSVAPMNGVHSRKDQKVFFSFGPCTARQGEPRSGERALWRVFSFSALRKGGAPAGAQRSGSGGERRKERSLSGIFGFSRKWSGGVSSDDMGGAMNQPSSWLNLPRPSGREKASPGQSGQPSLKPRQKTWREPPSQPGSHPPRPGGQTPESPRC